MAVHLSEEGIEIAEMAGYDRGIEVPFARPPGVCHETCVLRSAALAHEYARGSSSEESGMSAFFLVSQRHASP